MVMTGIYADTIDSVTVTATIETELNKRLPDDGYYDDGLDVEFHCCADGIVIDIPLLGSIYSRWALNFNDIIIQHQNQFALDLKAIYDGKPTTAEKRLDCMKIIMDSA